MDSGQPSRSLRAQESNMLSRLPSQGRAPHSTDDEGGLDLGQVVATLRRRIFVILGVTTLVTSGALLKGLTSKPVYQAGFELLTKPVTVESQVISSVPQTLSSSKEQTTQPEKGLDQTKLRLLNSPKLLDPVVKELQKKYPGLTYEGIVANLKIMPVPGTEILAVSYQGGDSKLVKDVINLVDDIYLNYSLEERLADVNQGIKFVDAQLPQLRNRVDGLQENLQNFRQKYNLVDPETQGKQLSEQLGAFLRAKLDLQVQLTEARTLYANLQGQLEQLPIESTSDNELTNNARYQRLLDKLLEVDSQIATESSLFLDQSNNIKALRDQRQNLIPLLSREGQRVQAGLASKIQALEAKNEALLDTEADLNRRVKELSVMSKQYAEIQRELQIATENLNQFLTKREALRIDAGQKQTPWQLLSPPSEPTPSTSNLKRTVMLGSILGVLLGVGCALLVDRLGSVIYSPEELKTITKLPSLGVAPWFSIASLERSQTRQLTDAFHWLPKAPLPFRSHEPGSWSSQLIAEEEDSNQSQINFATLEAFHSIYTNIRLLSPDHPIRSLVITSPDTQDGKSTIAVNLAQAAASMSQRVLLIDADLRNPQLHHRLGLAQFPGLGELISANLSLEKVIQQFPKEESLYILTAGQIPPDPIRILASQKMHTLMQELENAFDLIIYDTPPLVGLADANIIASKTDAILLVARLGKTNRVILDQALDILKIPPTLVLGTIANGAQNYVVERYGAYKRIRQV